MAEEEYNDIKEQVGEEMEAPAPTAQIRGMRPSIISQKPMLEEAPEEEEPITRFSAPQPMIPNHAEGMLKELRKSLKALLMKNGKI